MTSEIIWTGSPDDQTARINEYEIHAWVEFENYVCWDFQCGVDYVSGSKYLTIEEAKTACEKAYYEHLKTNL